MPQKEGDNEETSWELVGHVGSSNFFFSFFASTLGELPRLIQRLVTILSEQLNTATANKLESKLDGHNYCYYELALERVHISLH